MAILKNGIHGPFSGRVGNIVGYELNGQNIIRSLPVYPKKKRKPSELALLNRARMAAVSQFLRPLKRIIEFGYKNVAPKGSRVGPFQTAQSHTFKNALEYGEGNIPYVDPGKVLVFRGSLPPPRHLEMIVKDNVLNFTWGTDKPNRPYGLLVAAVYIEGGHAYFVDGLASAADGKAQWELPSNWDNKSPVHVYGGFYDLIGDQLSDSVYGGRL